MRQFVTLVAIVFCHTASAGDSTQNAPNVDVTIDKGLAFLAKDAIAWRDKHNCVSCHHAALVSWSMQDAKLRGRQVDEPVLEEMTKWVAESGDGKTGVPRPKDRPKAANYKALWFALSLEANPKLDDASRKGLNLLLETVKSNQLEDGSWLAWTDTRAPIFGDSSETATILATLALLPAASAGDEAAKLARDRATTWLSETKTDNDPQSLALRLVLWQRIGRPAQELEPLVEQIKSRQNLDGGWSQTKAMASDAWATGQALYALANAGTKPDDPVIKKAHEFLSKTQKDDGSWPMTSRPTKPGGDGAKNLIPITGAGSAWAILGLVHSR